MCCNKVFGLILETEQPEAKTRLRRDLGLQAHGGSQSRSVWEDRLFLVTSYLFSWLMRSPSKVVSVCVSVCASGFHPGGLPCHKKTLDQFECVTRDVSGSRPCPLLICKLRWCI